MQQYILIAPRCPPRIVITLLSFQGFWLRDPAILSITSIISIDKTFELTRYARTRAILQVKLSWLQTRPQTTTINNPDRMPSRTFDEWLSYSNGHAARNDVSGKYGSEFSLQRQFCHPHHQSLSCFTENVDTHFVFSS